MFVFYFLYYKALQKYNKILIYAEKCKKMEKYFFWCFKALIFNNLDPAPPTQTASAPYTPLHFFSKFFIIFYIFLNFYFFL